MTTHAEGVYKTWARPWPTLWPTLWPTPNFAILPIIKEKLVMCPANKHLSPVKGRGMGAMFFNRLILVPGLFSAECTIGMVWGLTPLKHYGNKALMHYFTKAIRCKV